MLNTTICLVEERAVFIVPFRDALDPKRIQDLDKLAEDQISIRGFNLEKVKPRSDLCNKKFFLPVNEIVGDYCPTHRYSYIRKIEKLKPKSTWVGLKGNIIDSICPEMFKELGRYASSSNLNNLYLIENLNQHTNQAVQDARTLIDQKKSQLKDPPSDAEIEEFLKELQKILRFENELSSALLDFKISLKEDIKLSAELLLLFPFNVKCKLSAPDLGFSGSAEPDFIYANRVMGDIKSGVWRESFPLTPTAYALAYENETGRKMNLGVIINPVMTQARTVPLHTHSEIYIIDNALRKAVLANRDQKLNMIRMNAKPPLPDQNTVCQPCGYYDECWAEIAI
jgi:CRISPR/Cas system-associated exonuclease Cas4 (RecB family)